MTGNVPSCFFLLGEGQLAEMLLDDRGTRRIVSRLKEDRKDRKKEDGKEKDRKEEDRKEKGRQEKHRRRRTEGSRTERRIESKQESEIVVRSCV